MAADDRRRSRRQETHPGSERRYRDRFLVTRAESQRLDIPRRPGHGVRLEYDPEFVGRFAEGFARFMGTGRFLGYMTAFIAAWILWNAFGPDELRFDDFPFIFLTLMLSIQASYAAPLILLAQNRQEARDRVQYNVDRDMDARARADTEFLAREVAALRLAVSEVATRDYLRSELRGLLTDLDERAGRTPGGTPTPVR